ncbi:LacI family transcriptional regulator [Capsulimonas corticalis]|uniref:LacI family transcriptional regulator n=1 Tax=Capsulimonas corticalis TaxID=2219043 RepID=A0A402D510_9BACT|nr:LacI family transcriptional regulator [Capsulimonas corticalis]
MSPATVSRSFTDSPMLSADTRQRVLEVAKRLNYRPPHVRKKQRERALIREDAATGVSIGLQFFAPADTATIQGDAFYAPMMTGAQAETEKLGMHLLLHTTNRRKMLTDLPRMIRDQIISGMLLVGSASPEILDAFLEHVPQIVLVDNRDLTGKHDCILSDGIGGATAATQYLFELGHSRVAFAMSDPETTTFQDRLTGYLSAHFKAGRTADPSLLICATTEAQFSDQVTAMLSRPDRPTAILAANDPHAYRLMQICRDLGLQIPDDVSIVGFDDDKHSSLCYPALTTLRVDTAYMGQLAVQRLATRLLELQDLKDEDAAPRPPINIEVPVSLIVRGSCRAIA